MSTHALVLGVVVNRGFIPLLVVTFLVGLAEGWWSLSATTAWLAADVVGLVAVVEKLSEELWDAAERQRQG